MKKRLLAVMIVCGITIYGAGCLLPANLLLELAGDVLDGDGVGGDDIGDDMDTNGTTDTPDE